MARLKKAGLKVVKEGSIKADVLDKKKLIDQHYYAISSKATSLKPEQLNVPGDKLQAQLVKLGGGFYCGLVKIAGKSPLYIFNGDFMPWWPGGALPGLASRCIDTLCLSRHRPFVKMRRAWSSALCRPIKTARSFKGGAGA